MSVLVNLFTYGISGTCAYISIQMDELLSAFFSDPVLKMSGRTTVRDPQVLTLNENADMLVMITQQGGLYPTDLVTTVNYLESVVR